MEVKLPYDHVCLFVGRLVSWSVAWFLCHNFLKEDGKFHFHAPIGALVFSKGDSGGPMVCQDDNGKE